MKYNGLVIVRAFIGEHNKINDLYYSINKLISKIKKQKIEDKAVNA
jgi:hypothetical protein